MDYKEKILLGSKKNINSVDVDNFLKINLNNEESITSDYKIKHFIDSSVVFDEERENCHIYRIYGVIEYFSLLNGVVENYENNYQFFLKNFFNTSEEVKDLLNTFKIYLLKPSKEYDEIEDTDNLYTKKYEVIATPNELNIKKAGFSVNLFSEKKYYFDFSIDIDVSNSKTGFNHPITELFLYFEYQPSGSEEVFYTPHLPPSTYMINENCVECGICEAECPTNAISEGTPFIINQDECIYCGLCFSICPENAITEDPPILPNNVPNVDWNIGDILYDEESNRPIGCIVEKDDINYKENKIKDQLFKIKTPTNQNNVYWKYNPFIPIRLRHLSEHTYTANKNLSSHEEKITIPDHAIELNNDGDVIWREILIDGIFDVTTDLGVDHPFVNKRKYVFSNLILDITPDFNYHGTRMMFENVVLSESQTTTNVPINKNINKIGLPCQ